MTHAPEALNKFAGEFRNGARQGTDAAEFSIEPLRQTKAFSAADARHLSRHSNSPSRVALPPLTEHFEFGQIFEVPGTASRPFGEDQGIQPNQLALDSEDIDGDGLRHEIFIAAGPGDLSQQVDPAQIRAQREVQPRSQRLEIEMEWQPWRSAPQIWVVRAQGSRDAPQVLVVPSVNHIQDLRRAGEPCAAAATPTTNTKRTPPAPRIRSSSPNWVTLPLRGGPKFLAKALELL